MFRRIFAVLFALLMLCSCGAEEPEKPVVPEEPEISGESEIPEEEPEQEKNPENPEATEFERNAITLTGLIAEHLFDVSEEKTSSETNKLMNVIFTIGANAGNPVSENKPYADSFPKSQDGIYHFPEDEIVRVAFEIFGIEDFRYEEPKGVAIYYDEENREFYTGFEFGMGGRHSIRNPAAVTENDEICVEFELTDSVFYSDMPGWTVYGKYESVFKVLENENGKFLRFVEITCRELYEPLLITEHIAALNEIFKETFYTGFDWNGETYARLFKTEQVNGTTAEAIPNLMMKNSEIDEKGIPEGYFEDAGDADCYLVEDYYSKAGIYGVFGQWLSEEIYGEAVERNMIEYDGRLYMVRGGRGYGVESCSGFVITGQTETEITATGNYFTHGDPNGTIDLVFSVSDGKIILESYNINYADR